MAKKTLSFAEKAAKKKNKTDIKYVKYVGSVRSEKTGQWRFNERMIGLQGGESLDAALKRIDKEKKLLNIELPDPDQAQVESAATEEGGEIVEVAEEGEFTEEASDAEETVETEEVGLSETAEDSGQEIDEEPGKQI